MFLDFIFPKTRLYLCEKPSQARTVARDLGADVRRDGAYLGRRIIVTWCHGHMVEKAPPEAYNPDYREWNLSDLPIVPSKWYGMVKPGNEQQFDKIGFWLQQSDEVVIATDPDDEGEVIGRAVLKAWKYSNPVKRAWVSALSPERLGHALRHPVDLHQTDSYYRAGDARSKLDWLIGVNLTRAFTVAGGLGRTVNVGRVMTPLLDIVARREDMLTNYEPQDRVVATAHATIGGKEVHFRFWPDSANVEFDEFDDDRLVSMGSAVANVESVVSDGVSVRPPPPYDLTSLQIDAVNQGWSAMQSYEAAQALYESGDISYPRTSSNSMPGDGNQSFAAHHAIVPLTSSPSLSLSGAQYAIWDLVNRRYLAQQAGYAEVLTTTCRFEIDGEPYWFRRLELTEEGWLKYSPDDDLSERSDCKKRVSLHAGDRIEIKRISVEIQPDRSSMSCGDAYILGEMKRLGLGTDATRAFAIEKLIANGMLARVGRMEVQTTSFGREVLEMMPPELKSASFTEKLGKTISSARDGKLDIDEYVHSEFTYWLNTVIGMAGAKSTFLPT